jgi:chromosome partitioning protein
MVRVVFNQKGGVGKSTITCNLAAISAASGLSTLVIDLDAQGNSSHYILGNATEVQSGAAELFAESLAARAKTSAPESFITASPWDNLGVMAASPALADLQSKLEAKLKIYKLKEAVDALKKQFKSIWIDTPPALNFFTLSALIAADRCLVPFDCDDFSRQALYRLLENVEEIRADHNKKLKVEGIVVNQFSARSNLPQRVVDELKAEKLPVLEPYLSGSIRIKESHELCRPLIYLEPSHKVTQEYLALWQSLKH